MANEPTHGPGVTQPGRDGHTSLRTAGLRPCPSCTAQISVHATVCPNCGEHLAAREKVVRCQRCRRRASSNLVVCPHCGRDLHAATTRWLTWGIPLLALLLLAGLLLVRFGRSSPMSWVEAQSERVARLIESVSSRLQPEFSVAMIPPGENADDPLVVQASQAGQGAAATINNPPDLLPVAAPPDAAQVQPAATSIPADAGAAADATATTQAPAAEATTAQAPVVTTEPTAAATATALPTSLPTATATSLPATPPATPTTIATPTAAATAIEIAAAAANSSTLSLDATPTAIGSARIAAASRATAVTPAVTPAATATLSEAVSLLGLVTLTAVPPTPTPLALYQVQRGDTLFDIASQYDMSVEDLLAANNLTEEDVYTIQPGDELAIPAPTPVGRPTATPGPTAATYTVRAGDTILAIALRLDLTMEELLAANNMTVAEARSLQPGAVLLLPGQGPLPEPTALATPTLVIAPTSTSTPAATATIAGTPLPASTTIPTTTMRVDAPRLRSPENGAAVSCSSEGILNWGAVPSTLAADIYLVHLGYVNSIAADGTEEVIWVITQQQPMGKTSWSLDNDLCGLAPVTDGKQWRWYVEVAEKTAEGLQPVSPASPTWGFAWQ